MKLLDLANTSFKDGDYQTAKKKYNEFVGLYPEYTDILNINITFCDMKLSFNINSQLDVVSRVNNPKVSIIVPVHNVEEYLDQCINSILKQSLFEIELILVDDGSSDRSFEIIKKYESKDKRVVYIHNKYASGNSGTPRNQALMKAKGEYVAFVDSDDWIDENMLQDLYTAAIYQDADIATSSGFYREKSGEVEQVKVVNAEYLPEENQRRDLFMGGQFPIVWYRVYKRDFIQTNQIKFGETKTSADLPFAFKALFKANKVVAVDGCYYHYRFDRVGSTIERRKGAGAFELLKSYAAIVEFLKLNGGYEEYIPYVVYKAIGDYTYNLKLLDDKYHEAFAIAIAKLVFEHEKYIVKSNIFNKYWTSVLNDLKPYANKESNILNQILSVQKEQIKVSVVVPAYNVEEYISKTLTSILDQKLVNLEVIVVNDGSKDNTQKVIDKFAAKDARVKSIELSLSSGNAGTPRNIALVVAQGEYIGFVDSDDYVSPSMFSKLYEEAEQKGADIASQSSFYRVENGVEKKIKINYQEFYNVKERNKVFKSNYFSNIWNRIYKTDLIKRNNIYFPNIYLSEDMCFSFAAHAYANKAIQVGGCYYFYIYNREDSTTHLRTQEKGFEVLNSMHAIQKYFDNFGIYDDLSLEIIDKKLNSIAYTYDRLDENLKADFIKKAKKIFEPMLGEVKDINELSNKKFLNVLASSSI